MTCTENENQSYVITYLNHGFEICDHIRYVEAVLYILLFLYSNKNSGRISLVAEGIGMGQGSSANLSGGKVE